MKARIKLRPIEPKSSKPVQSKQVTAQGESIRLVDLFGRRWCAGESIRSLASEAGMKWNELQAKLRAAGYLRAQIVVSLFPTNRRCQTSLLHFLTRVSQEKTRLRAGEYTSG